MKWIFLKEQILEAGQVIELRGELFHYLHRVLRLGEGDEIQIRDQSSRRFHCRIDQLGPAMLRVEAKEEVEEDQATSGKIKLTLYQGLPKAKKLSWIIEKATELGVSEIVPVITSRSIPKIPELKLRQKLDHWERIVKQASEQCGRKDIPLIDFPGDLFSKVHPLREGELGIVLWENGTVPLRDILQSHTHVARVHVVIGPEGGLAESEIRYLKTCGFAVVHLGQRTMRTETAPLAILAILGYHYGDIG